MVICILSAAGVSRAVPLRDVSLMSANVPDPMGGGWDENNKGMQSAPPMVYATLHVAAIDDALLAEKKLMDNNNHQSRN